jgi:PST family polysaccharide transporter
VWSLIVQVVVSTSVRTILLWVTSSWRPQRRIDVPAIRELWRYSSHLAGYNAVNYWARNGDNFLIGKFVGAAGLGIYSRSYNLMLLPIQQISTVTALVMFPALARIQSDKERVKRAYLRAVGVIALLSFPVMTGMFVVAKPFIVTLYGPHWVAAVPVLQILCVAGLMQPVAATAGWLYQSQGRTDWLFRWGLVASGTMVCSFVIGIHWGVKGVAFAYTGAIYAVLYLTFSIPGRLIGMRVREVFQAMRGAMLSALGMAAIVWAVGRSLPTGWPPSAELAVQFVVGVVAYAALIRIFVFQRYLELRELVRGRFRGTVTSPA